MTMPSSADRHRRDDQRRAGSRDAADADREVGADRVERAVREVDDAAEREDQRQAERDQQVVDAVEQAVEQLLEEQHRRQDGTADARRSPSRRRSRHARLAARSGACVPRLLRDDASGVALSGASCSRSPRRGRDHLQRSFGPGTARRRREDVPLVLDLRRRAAPAPCTSRASSGGRPCGSSPRASSAASNLAPFSKCSTSFVAVGASWSRSSPAR